MTTMTLGRRGGRGEVDEEEEEEDMMAMRTLPAGRHGRKCDRREGVRARPRRVLPTMKRVVVGAEARTIKRWQLTRETTRRRRRRRIVVGRKEKAR